MYEGCEKFRQGRNSLHCFMPFHTRPIMVGEGGSSRGVSPGEECDDLVELVPLLRLLFNGAGVLNHDCAALLPVVFGFWDEASSESMLWVGPHKPDLDLAASCLVFLLRNSRSFKLVRDGLVLVLPPHKMAEFQSWYIAVAMMTVLTCSPNF